MRSTSHPLTYLFVTLMISSVLVMTAGCGLRFGSGSKSTGKGKNASLVNPHDGSVVWDDQYAHSGVQNGMNSGHLDEGGNGEGLGENDSMVGEDPFAQGWPPTDSAEDYWAQRDRAEVLTAKTGIRDIFFEFDSWHLTNEAKGILTSNAEWLKAHPFARVTIEGHCDARGTRAYNYVLGDKRARRTRNYLASLGVAPSQLTVMSYGKDNPLCRTSSGGCFKQNRRAHLVLGTNVASSIQ